MRKVTRGKIQLQIQALKFRRLHASVYMYFIIVSGNLANASSATYLANYPEPKNYFRASQIH